MDALKGKKTLVLGLGLSGRSAAAFLLERGAHVLGFDQSHITLSSDPDIAALCSKGLIIAPDTEIPSDIKGYDFLVASPGVSQQHPLYQAAKNAKLEIIGEVELACRTMKNRMIGITGTNGKTTVTLLVAHILNCAGIPAVALGNVGVPMTAELLHGLQEEKVIVVELSSFQLETLKARCLDAAVVLNITPDHLDRYETMEDYAKAKWHIGKCLKPGKPLYAEKRTFDTYRRQLGDRSCWLYGYSSDCAVFTDGQHVFFHGKVEALLPGEYRGKVSHDVENLMAAFALCCEFGVLPEAFIKGFETFKKPSHRIEFVRELNGVAFYDDSKGTNIDAVIRAVESLPGFIILIAGGVDKGAPYDPWINAFKGKVKQICAIGQAAPKMKHELSAAFPVELFPTLEQAVKFASSIAKPGDHVLLSPGCSSFDMFRNYAHRGEEFQRIVTGL